MKPASSMHERFTALTAPSASAGESRAAAWYDAEAFEILQRVTGLAKSDEFRRKEHDLGALFARLTVLECRVLHKRLSNPAPDDQLASAFSRLVLERRGRLLMYLADARRREALGSVARLA